MKRTNIFITIFMIFTSIIIVLCGFLLFLAILNLHGEYIETLKIVEGVVNGV